MYKVIGLPVTRTLRVLWCLEELGQTYESIPAYPHTDEIKAVNPSGKVPALIDGDDVILDSAAICQYLADKHEALTFPTGTVQRAHMQSWINFANDDIESPLWVFWKHTMVRPEGQRVEAIKPVCKQEFGRAMKAFEARLGDNKYVMGDVFTVPDIIITHCANWAVNTCKFNLPEGKVTDYVNRVRSRPAYKRTIEKFMKQA